jgi:hypothetical protein
VVDSGPAVEAEADGVEIAVEIVAATEADAKAAVGVDVAGTAVVVAADAGR